MRILERPCVGSNALAVLLLMLGCGKPVSDVPAEPFKAAVVQYLDQHNMGLSIKEIKEGPTVSGNSATMRASMQATGAGGPSVTWEFQFEKSPQGQWKAVSHKP